MKNIGAPAVAELITALSHRDEKVRREVVTVLGEIRAPAAVPALIQALNDRDAEVRQNAVEALKRIGTSEALKALENPL